MPTENSEPYNTSSYNNLLVPLITDSHTPREQTVSDLSPCTPIEVPTEPVVPVESPFRIRHREKSENLRIQNFLNEENISFRPWETRETSQTSVSNRKYERSKTVGLSAKPQSMSVSSPAKSPKKSPRKTPVRSPRKEKVLRRGRYTLEALSAHDVKTFMQELSGSPRKEDETSAVGNTYVEEMNNEQEEEDEYFYDRIHLEREKKLTGKIMSKQDLQALEPSTGRSGKPGQSLQSVTKRGETTGFVEQSFRAIPESDKAKTQTSQNSLSAISQPRNGGPKGSPSRNQDSYPELSAMSNSESVENLFNRLLTGECIISGDARTAGSSPNLPQSPVKARAGPGGSSATMSPAKPQLDLGFTQGVSLVEKTEKSRGKPRDGGMSFGSKESSVHSKSKGASRNSSTKSGRKPGQLHGRQRSDGASFRAEYPQEVVPVEPPRRQIRSGIPGSGNAGKVLSYSKQQEHKKSRATVTGGRDTQKNARKSYLESWQKKNGQIPQKVAAPSSAKLPLTTPKLVSPGHERQVSEGLASMNKGFEPSTVNFAMIEEQVKKDGFFSPKLNIPARTKIKPKALELKVQELIDANSKSRTLQFPQGEHHPVNNYNDDDDIIANALPISGSQTPGEPVNNFKATNTKEVKVPMTFGDVTGSSLIKIEDSSHLAAAKNPQTAVSSSARHVYYNLFAAANPSQERTGSAVNGTPIQPVPRQASPRLDFRRPVELQGAGGQTGGLLTPKIGGSTENGTGAPERISAGPHEVRVCLGGGRGLKSL